MDHTIGFYVTLLFFNGCGFFDIPFLGKGAKFYSLPYGQAPANLY